MESLTKLRVSETELDTLVRRGFGPDAQITQWRELTEGHYNVAYAVRLADGADLVLKIAPPPGLKLLSHEVDLMRTEIDFFRRARAGGVAVPEVVFADTERDLVGSDFVFLSRIDGVTLNTVRDTLSPGGLAAVRAQVAAETARLHTISGPAYGYPLRDSRSWQPTWRAAFEAMVRDILDDALRLGTRLPVGVDEIAARLHRRADLLDQVDRPALIHFDLWDGNVFVLPDGTGGATLTGLIDGERALYGDPVAEFVSMTLFRDPAELPGLLAAYRGAGHTSIQLTPDVRHRLALYTCYLYLIMLVEGGTRGWQGPERESFEDRLAGLLVDQLDQID
ncbi:fructosamine-3-kinase [Micromonospora pisi]|uniref:Fructosamine-3-kinase n=1 Tax=Micromonospora pisi TaxID=589240 RepID=A0A495JDZ3_9ACTN|nr:aminoglycoside phosphotransferase family protein [Micromonospora pisi]RKR86748.1 fructosamine-3-kinase [Micromonospora pisi]